MIHFSAELSSRTKADYNKLSDERIKIIPAAPHTLGLVQKEYHSQLMVRKQEEEKTILF